MDMKKLEFLDIYPDPISGSEKGYISISYIQHLDIYPGYISNGYISYPFLWISIDVSDVGVLRWSGNVTYRSPN